MSIHITDTDTDAVEYEEVEQEVEQEENYTPEAFTPVFNVAPEIAPPPTEQVHIPTEDEKKSTLEKMYARLGVKAKELVTEEVLPLTDEQLRYVSRTSLLAARIFTSIAMWGWSIFGVEYQIVAPTVQHSQKMIEPIFRIVARHTPVVGNISPDVDDIIEATTAISDYALYAMAMMQQIREDKLEHNGRYTGTFTSTDRFNTGEIRPSSNGSRSNDIRGFTTPSNEPTENSRDAEHTHPEDHLTDNERFNRDALSLLRARDFQARARKSGRV